MKWHDLSLLFCFLVAREAVVAQDRSKFCISSDSYRVVAWSQKSDNLFRDLLILQGSIQTSAILSIVDISNFISSYAPPSKIFSPSHSGHSVSRMTLLIPWSDCWTVSSLHVSNTGSTNHTKIPSRRRRKRPSTHSPPISVRTFTPTSTMLRIQREWKEMIKSGVAFNWQHGAPVQHGGAPSHIWIGPLTFRQWYLWHFTFTGIDTRGLSSDGTDATRYAISNPYQNGVYHGRLILPKTYPMHPPRIQLLTPNGRYAVGQDICLSVSSYHPETWQLSSWNIVSIIESLRYHMMTSNIQNEIGTIQPPMSFEQKQLYADQSRRWKRDLRSQNDVRSARSIVRVDHYRMIREGWISDVPGQSIDNMNKSLPISQLKLRDDEVFDHHANWSIFLSVQKRRRALRTSNVALPRKTSTTRKIQRHKKNVSLSEMIYRNGCKLLFSYPWVTFGLFGLLFLILNIEVRCL